jgi:hypothetical protein
MLGRHGELAGELDALAQEHPLRERLWGQLMVALYRSGRQGDALRAYQRARTVLADELGVDPGIALKRLESAVLNQDPALGGPGRRRVGARCCRARASRPRPGPALLRRAADGYRRLVTPGLRRIRCASSPTSPSCKAPTTMPSPC